MTQQHWSQVDPNPISPASHVDHVRWVTPVNAMELAQRAGLSLDSYYTLETHGSTWFRKRVLRFVNWLLGKNELLAWAYLYCFRHQS